MKGKGFCFFVLFIIMLTSCKRIFNLSHDISPVDKIIDDLQNKKVIFIGENHSDVYPVIFMTENIQKFYDMGVRYLFLEGGCPRLRQNYTEDNYSFVVGNPCINMGWKYEYYCFEEVVLRINQNNLSDQLQVIFPEEDIIEFNHSSNEGLAKWMNYRDSYIQKNIIDVLEKSNKEDKAIVFYGSAHGKKYIQKWNENGFEWKTTGSYLYDYYKDLFTNYKIDYIYPTYQWCYKLNDENLVCLSEKNKQILFKNDEQYSRAYDNICLTKNIIYGVPYSYVPTKENLLFLLKKAKELSNEQTMVKEDNSSLSKILNKETFVLINYYLKYLFGDYYDYDLTNSEKTMQYAIAKLEKECYSGKNPCDFVCVNYKLEELEKYMFYLFSEGVVETYCSEDYSKNTKEINFILRNMTQAKKINTRDIWPQYWISYFKTEKAIKSDKKKDYQKALLSWNELLQNDLLYASPVLKISYEKMILCENKIGNFEKQKFYQEKERNVRNDVDFDYGVYKNFGF